jgi:hypothetical protein
VQIRFHTVRCDARQHDRALAYQRSEWAHRWFTAEPESQRVSSLLCSQPNAVRPHLLLNLVDGRNPTRGLRFGWNVRPYAILLFSAGLCGHSPQPVDMASMFVSL